METFDFEIARLPFQVQVDWPVTVSDNFLPFLTDGAQPWQERIRMTCTDALQAPDAPPVWERNRAETTVDGKPYVLHRLSDTAQPYLSERYDAPNDRLFCYRAASNELPLSMHKVFNNMQMEALMLRHETLILHSALIRWQDAAILFSAPSGTGKSTQADLWAKYKGADILNGDRSALRKLEGRWAAFGLPFAGSSDIFRNEGAPVRTIVMLEQAPQNTITRLSPAQAMRRIWPEFTVHRWDPAFTNRSLDLVLDLLASVPVYLLSCRPDEGAVQLLHDTITQEV